MVERPTTRGVGRRRDGRRSRTLKKLAWLSADPMAGRNVLVCVAWPYANGSLHLGHVAGSLLPPDIFARYQRAAGNRVLMVSGSDCHGTPITVTAEKMGLTPAQVVDKYHAEHKQSLVQLGIRFDLFTQTTTQNHRDIVHAFFLAHREQGYLKEETTQGMYCPKDQRFLPDRYVEGTCPHCGNPNARGDQCDKCGKTLDPADLKGPRCKLCQTTPEVRPTKHFFFRLSAFEGRLKQWLADKAEWRPNTINFTNNWLKEGLKDRAITRDLTWGVPVPLPGYDEKRIYVWYEAVIGYYSASVEWAYHQGDPDLWTEWWLNPEARHYYFLGKDNIPFHTIIWPAMLLGYSDSLVQNGLAPGPLNLPHNVPANEFLTLSGQQFSKSRGVGITLPDILSKFDPETIRYYLSINMPEQRDADWSWDDFIAKTNDELVGAFGNYAHRVLSFTHQHYGAIPVRGALTDRDRQALARIEEAAREVAAAIEACEFKKGIREGMRLAQFGNQYVDEMAPWSLVKTDRERCGTVLNVCLQIVKGLSVILQPYLPFGAQKLWQALGEPGRVEEQSWTSTGAPVRAGTTLEKPAVLYRKIDPAEVAEKPAQAIAAAAPKDGASKPLVSFDEFQRLDLRVGHVLSVDNHPNADKLYVLKIDIGGDVRQVVAGMRAHYTPDELVGKQVALVANLAPVKIRGVESQGMIFGADDGAVVTVLRPDKAIKTGAKIR
jgi:methionyl-tRNA synthetase